MNTSPTIGVLTPLRNIYRGRRDFFSRVIAGAQSAASLHKSQLLLVEAAMIQKIGWSLAMNQVDGWIILGHASSPMQQVTKPLVTVALSLPGIPTVMPDNRTGMNELMQHLFSHGHEKIAFIGDWSNPDICQRYEIYKNALAQRGISLDQRIVIEPVFPQEIRQQSILTISGGRAAASVLLNAGLPCTAVVCGTDLMALGFMEEVQKAGISIPKELAVVGFDDEDAAQYSNPPLTTVHHQFEVVGYKAVEILVEFLRQAIPLPLTTYTNNRMIIRRSCGCDPIIHETINNIDVTKNWQESLAQRLVEIAQPGDDGTSGPPGQIWPGVTTLIRGIQAAIGQTSLPGSTDIARAWDQSINLTSDIDRLCAILNTLEDEGYRHLHQPEKDGPRRKELAKFLFSARVEMIRSHQIPEKQETEWLNWLLAQTQSINATLFGHESHKINDLTWLAETPANWGCLVLWPLAEDFSELVIAGSFHRGNEPFIKTGSHIQPADFPPLLLDHEDPFSLGTHALFWLQTPMRAWGILYVNLPPSFPVLSFGLWADFLGISLERASLIKMINRMVVPIEGAVAVELSVERIEMKLPPSITTSSTVVLRMVEKGMITYWAAGKLKQQTAGQLVVYWNALPMHISTIEPGTSCYQVSVPLRWIFQCDFPKVITQPLLYGELLSDSAPGDLAMFTGWYEYINEKVIENQKIVLLEIEARLLRLSRSMSKGENQSIQPPPHSKQYNQPGKSQANGPVYC